MKKIIDFISKERTFIREHYETKSNNSLFMDLVHLILWGGGLLLFIFGILFLFISIFVVLYIGFNSGIKIKFDSSVFLIPLGALAASYFFKKIRVWLFYKKNK